jgi:hypothetical protein
MRVENRIKRRMSLMYTNDECNQTTIGNVFAQIK